MTNEALFNLIYAGAISSGFSEQQVKANFVEKLNIPEERVARLFNGKSIVLKKSLSLEKAEKWQQKLLQIGAEVAMVPSVDPQNNTNNKVAEDVDIKHVTNSNSTGSQAEYDQDMQERINKAKAMIAAQMMEQQLNTPKKSDSTKRMFIFAGVMAIFIIMSYFYAESIT